MACDDDLDGLSDRSDGLKDKVKKLDKAPPDAAKKPPSDDDWGSDNTEKDPPEANEDLKDVNPPATAG